MRSQIESPSGLVFPDEARKRLEGMKEKVTELRRASFARSVPTEVGVELDVLRDSLDRALVALARR